MGSLVCCAIGIFPAEAGGREVRIPSAHKMTVKRQTKEARKMKTWRRIVSLLVLAFVVFAASSALAAELDQEVLYHVNIMRVNAGVAPLALNRELAAASYVRAAEAEVNFAHRRPDGREVKSVFANASFAWFGENLAVSKKADAEAIVRAWMNSPTHRANLLNRHYTKMGIACVKGNDGRYYWAQEMASE